METIKENLSPEESLKIINKMITSAKTNLGDSSFNFLFWGWTISLISLSHFILEYFKLSQMPQIVWFLIFPGIAVVTIYNIKKSRKRRVFSHIEKIYSFAWLAFIISYFIIIIFMKEINYNITPIIFILIANATFISGLALKFRPLIYGTILFWISAIVCFLIPNEFIQLLNSIAVILGFLIPGYLLKSEKYKNA
ncbi:MAG: hypothetical protein MI739_03465 [Bacteroidales bacterium]|nr:hypothetical protein [Bacteroidales bacterium]